MSRMIYGHARMTFGAVSKRGRIAEDVPADILVMSVGLSCVIRPHHPRTYPPAHRAERGLFIKKLIDFNVDTPEKDRDE
jgi:hypothetical protein